MNDILNAPQFVWAEKWRPRKIEDTILPDDTKNLFLELVKKGNIPNLLLTGSQGTGKTTVARALCDEIGADYIIINGSMNGGIDTLRNEIKNFASTVSFSGGRKVVIIDEADYLSQQTQAALRNFMEEYSKNCGFIMTCNFKNRILRALHSRCSVIDFKIPTDAKAKLAAQFMKRITFILDTESIEYDKKAVAAVIMKFFPDFRRVLNELQRYGVCGKIDSGVLAGMNEESFSSLVEMIKGMKWKDVRTWLGENVDAEPIQLMRKFYDQSYDFVKPQSIPALVLLIAQYQFQSGFVADQEINTMAFLTDVMSGVEFL